MRKSEDHGGGGEGGGSIIDTSVYKSRKYSNIAWSNPRARAVALPQNDRRAYKRNKMPSHVAHVFRNVAPQRGYVQQNAVQDLLIHTSCVSQLFVFTAAAHVEQ